MNWFIKEISEYEQEIENMTFKDWLIIFTICLPFIILSLFI